MRPRRRPAGARGLGGGRVRNGGVSPGLAGSTATESRGYRDEGEALALKCRGAPRTALVRGAWGITEGSEFTKKKHSSP
jgi:hypothetical protein